jgi:hypothetical protein
VYRYLLQVLKNPAILLCGLSKLLYFGGVSEHFLKVWEVIRTLSKVLWGVLEHYAKFEGGIWTFSKVWGGYLKKALINNVRAKNTLANKEEELIFFCSVIAIKWKSEPCRTMWSRYTGRTIFSVLERKQT